MKSFVTLLAVICGTSFAFASPDCTKSEAIAKAAEKQARKMNGRGSTASAGEISFTRTTKDGKQDEYTVEMTVNEECLSEVYIYVKTNTCEVNSAAGGTLSEGACG